jgi:hypothetical protein
MNRWRSFEKDFRDIKDDPSNFLTAAYYQCIPRQKTGAPETFGKWILVGGLAAHERARFETVASMAGGALTDYQGEVHKDVLKVREPRDRWLAAVFAMTNGYESHHRDYGEDDEGNHVTIINGSIKRIIEWSAILCLKLAACENETPNRTIDPDKAKSASEAKALPAATNRSRRAIIIHELITSKTDFANHGKVESLCTAMDAGNIPKKWKDILDNPKSAEYKRLFRTKNSTLLKDLYS